MKPPQKPAATIEQCKAQLAAQLGCHDDEAAGRLETLLEDKESLMRALQADSGEVAKLAGMSGERRLRFAHQLAKRASFITRMDSYNHKSRRA